MDLSTFTAHVIHQPSHILRHTLPPYTDANNFTYIIHRPEDEPNHEQSYTPYTPTPGIRVSYSQKLSHRLRDRVIYGPPHEYEPSTYPTGGPSPRRTDWYPTKRNNLGTSDNRARELLLWYIDRRLELISTKGYDLARRREPLLLQTPPETTYWTAVAATPIHDN